MVTQGRWHEAQAYEKAYWQDQAQQIASGSQGQLDWYAWKARMMEERFKGHLKDEEKERARLLEIGSGPIGIVTYLKWGERYTLDPLEAYYASDTTLSKLRSADVKYGQGSGERLPFEGEYFTIVILDNVLDHVHQAPHVLREIQRVLAKNGMFYIAVNIHTAWGGMLHRVLSKLKIDRGHPYTFTLPSIREFLAAHGFKVNAEFVNSYEEARNEDLCSHSSKAKVKAYLGLSEFVYHAVCSVR